MNSSTSTATIANEYLDFPNEVGIIYAMGLTYQGHIREVGEKPNPAIIFQKKCAPTIQPTELKTPNPTEIMAAIDALPKHLTKDLSGLSDNPPAHLDYEVELGVYLLEDVNDSRLKDPNWQPKLGFFLANDMTVRTLQICGEIGTDLQEKLVFWSASKSFEGFLPVAHQIWIPDSVSADRFPSLDIELSVNGSVRQRSNTDDIIYSPRQVLQAALSISSTHTLKRGDIVITGTPAGVAFKSTPLKRTMAKVLPSNFVIRKAVESNRSNQAFLRPGDLVSMKADKLGGFDFIIT